MAPAEREEEPLSGGWGLGPDAELAPGLVVVEPLRTGRRYDVYLVWDERRYALAVAKVLRPDRVDSARSREKLGGEAGLLSRLAHPLLVRLFEAVLDGARPYLLLEYVQADDLRELVRAQGPLEPDALVELGTQLAGALHYLALEDVVHLDVKPSNVLLATPPRLLDFGAARSLREARELGRPVGTDLYVAPEVCRAPESGELIGPAADVWSLGATLYYGLTGEPPFRRPPGARESADPNVRFPQLVERPAPLLGRGVPAALGKLVFELLVREPGDRPSAAEAADSLADL